MRSYPVKENPICLAVSLFLRYKHTDKHPVTLVKEFLYQRQGIGMQQNENKKVKIRSERKMYCNDLKICVIFYKWQRIQSFKNKAIYKMVAHIRIEKRFRRLSYLN